MSEVQSKGEEWRLAFSKAFITQASDAASYYIKMRFETLEEMHQGYNAMYALSMAIKAAQDDFEIITPKTHRE